MTTAPISVSPLSTTTPANAVAPAATGARALARTDKNRFAALLAKVETEKYPSGGPPSHTPARAQTPKHASPKTEITTATPAQLATPLQTDHRAWTLALPNNQKPADPKTSNPKPLEPRTQDDNSRAANANAQATQSSAAAALRQGETAFTVNFMKAAPVGVPPVHGPSSNPMSAVLPSAAASPTQNGGSQSKHSGKDEHHQPAPNSAEAPQALHAKPEGVADAAPQTPNNAPAQAPTSAMSSTHAPAAHVRDSSPVNPREVPPASTASQIVEPPTPATTRPHSMDFRVAGADDREVNVRVSQRAGDVQVTVRTGSADLAESLRQHLPELSDRLSQGGVPGEIWRPAGAAGSGADADLNSGHRNDGGAAGGNADSGSARNRNSNGQQQNAWLNELSGAEKEV